MKVKNIAIVLFAVFVGFTLYSYAANAKDEPEIEQSQQTSLDLDNVQQFVARFYRYILNREPDEEGLNAWSANLKSGREQGAQVGVGFIQSSEFKSRRVSNEEYIKLLYRAFFDREADASGLESWKMALDNGLTFMQVYRGFAESDEFSKLCEKYGIERGFVLMTVSMDQNEGVTKFIARCYKLCLDRLADENGLNAWCGKILSGENTAKQVAYGFVFSDEFIKKNVSDEEYIKMLYRLLLNREADSEGLLAWKGELLSGKSRFHIFEGFSDSNEFTDLCAAYGILPNRENIRIVLDPGHDNVCSRNHPELGFNEQDLNLKIAQACLDELNTYQGVEVFMTREDGSCPDNGVGSDDVTGRTAYAQSVDADLFVSIHNNATGLGYPSKANGAEVYISVHSAYTQESRKLGESILTELTTLLDLSNRGVLTRVKPEKGYYEDGNVKDWYYLISTSVERGFPGIIIEHAFMDNPHDNAILRDDEKLVTMGIADARGIAKYFGLEKK